MLPFHQLILVIPLLLLSLLLIAAVLIVVHFITIMSTSTEPSQQVKGEEPLKVAQPSVIRPFKEEMNLNDYKSGMAQLPKDLDHNKTGTLAPAAEETSSNVPSGTSTAGETSTTSQPSGMTSLCFLNLFFFLLVVSGV